MLASALKYLVVDDDDVDRERVKRMILQCDSQANISEASDLLDTTEALEKNDIDCLIVDYRLERLTGLDLLEKTKEFRSPYCATIMVTGLGNEEIVSDVLRAGFCDYLPKNQLNKWRLMRSIHSALHRSKLEKRLHELAYYDALTGLATRTLFTDRLQKVIDAHGRDSSLCAIAYIDLDHFKPINDSYGHHVGDQVLAEIAKRLKELVRKNDTAARLGGDEFALLLTNLNSTEDCEKLLKRVSSVVSQEIIIELDSETISLNTSASIGVCLLDGSSTSADTLLRHADHMMYQAKSAGRGGVLFFDPEVEKELKNSRDHLTEAAAAIKNNEFVLYYQPKIDLLSKKLLGVEALIRWQHPVRGLLLPSEFWGALQHKQLSRLFGEWVFREAAKQIIDWKSAGIDLVVSVNVSPYHLQDPSFIDFISQLIDEYPLLSEKCIELEILENSAFDDIHYAAGVISKCKALGFDVSIDDFGIGHSSLNYLKRLAVDTIKIDKSFVMNMLTDDGDMSIVTAILGLCKAFNKKVLAEGIDSVKHIQVLIDVGCTQGQGYALAKPMSANDFTRWCSQLNAM